MQVVTCRQFGPLEDLEIAEAPAPSCGDGDVRIDVRAAGVNFVDGLIVMGGYQLKPPLPFVPGGEVAGTVAEVGSGVIGLAVGDRVFASTGLSGAFASEAVVPAAAAIRTPDAMTDGQAATFTQSYMTARFALARRARAEHGETLLVLGAGGGIGLAAVDVGRAMGLHVIAAASTPQKRDLAVERGASATIDTSSEDLKTRARELSGGGVDIAYDPVGGAASEQALRALGPEGQLLVLGFAAGEIPKLPANQILLRNRAVTGVDWGNWTITHPTENREMLHTILEDIANGELRPVEPVARPLAEAPAALQDQLHRSVAGKSVLIPG